MARLGEFAAAKRELDDEKDDFVFCGEVFEVQRPMPAVLVLQLGASVSGKIEETEGFAAMWEALRVSLTIPEFASGSPPPTNTTQADFEADGNQVHQGPRRMTARSASCTAWRLKTMWNLSR